MILTLKRETLLTGVPVLAGLGIWDNALKYTLSHQRITNAKTRTKRDRMRGALSKTTAGRRLKPTLEAEARAAGTLH